MNCLVNRKQRDLTAFEQVQRSALGEPLGSDVEEVQLALYKCALHIGCGGRIEGGIEKAGPHPQLAHGVNLILHQRNQRGDHNTAAGPDQCRDLIAQRFSAARGHQYECVISLDDRLNNRFLGAAKAGVTEGLLENVERGRHMAQYTGLLLTPTDRLRLLFDYAR